MKILSSIILFVFLVKITTQKLIEINQDNQYIVFSDPISKEKNSKPLLVFFIDRQCDNCFSRLKEINQIAEITSKSHVVGRVDCEFERSICSYFPIEKLPFIVLITEGKTYQFNDEIEVKAIYEFLNNPDTDRNRIFNLSQVIAENSYQLLKGVLGHSLFSIQTLEKLSGIVLQRSKAFVNSYGFYYWSDYSKVIVYTMFVISPLFMILFFGMMLTCMYCCGLAGKAGKHQHRHCEDGQCEHDHKKHKDHKD